MNKKTWMTLKAPCKTISIEHKRSIFFPQRNKLKVRKKNLKQKLKEVNVRLLSSNFFSMNYAWWKQYHVKVSIRFHYVVFFFFLTHIITKAYPYAWRQKFIMAFHSSLKLTHWISQRKGTLGPLMNSVLCGGYGGQSTERRQPILQTLSCLVPLHLLKAFYTQRLWGLPLDELTEWTIKAFTMCFKSRIFFPKLSHVPIHFLFVLILGHFFPPLVQLFSVCPAFSCTNFSPS